MTGHGQKLSRKKESTIAALISLPTICDAAKSVGVGEKTLFRWLQLPEFQEAYRKARREIVKQAVAQIQGALSEAVKTLSDIMKDSKAPASARVTAARSIIDTAIKAVEIEDLESRLSALEEHIKDRK